MMGYYDLVLGLIPFGLGSIASALYLFGFETTVAVTLASLFALALIGHALFVNGPVEASPASKSDATGVRAD